MLTAEAEILAPADEYDTERPTRMKYVDRNRECWTQLAREAFVILGRAANDRSWAEPLSRYNYECEGPRLDWKQKEEEHYFNCCAPKLEKLTGADWCNDLLALKRMYDMGNTFDDAFECKFREIVSEQILFARKCAAEERAFGAAAAPVGR
jgi:hypothetical protein